MTMTKTIALTLCLFMPCVDGSRKSMQGLNLVLEEEARTQEPQCKRSCKIMDDATLNSCKAVPGKTLDQAIQLKANDKCWRTACKGCTGGGTTPDCASKDKKEEEIIKAPEAVPDADKPPVEDDTRPPECTLPGTLEIGGACRIANDVCMLSEAAWCMPPSTNPGHSYRQGEKPLCCSTEAAVTVDDTVDEAVEKVVAESKKPEVTTPPPLCAEDGEFEELSFTRGGKTVVMCSDIKTGQLTNKVCCKSLALAALKEQTTRLENKAKADEVCSTLESKYCKADVGTFEKNRKKAKGLPSDYQCQRKYMCVEGDFSFGPVETKTGCDGQSPTKFKKDLSPGNIPATTACVAVKKK